jgi:hypothetical protein
MYGTRGEGIGERESVSRSGSGFIPTRRPIFADNNVLVAAAERGNAAALAEIQAGQTLVTPNQLREFLNVNSATQRAARRSFLDREGIAVFGGQRAGVVARTSIFQEVFQAVVVDHGRADAALAAFAKATGFEAVTLEQRLTNFLTHTHQRLGVPLRSMPR